MLVPARGAAEPLAIAGMPDGYALSLEAPSIKAAAFAPDGKTLVTAGGDAKVRRWRTDEWVETVGIDANGGLSDVLVTDDGKHVVAVGVGGTTIWDMQSGSELAAREGAATVVAANHNASRVVSVGAGAASVWEPAHDRLRDLVVPGDTVRTAAITTDGGVVATGGQSGTIWLWDAVTGNRLDWLRLGRAPIRTLDFSFDNTSLVATTTTGVVRVLGCEICQPPERLIALARRRIGG